MTNPGSLHILVSNQVKGLPLYHPLAEENDGVELWNSGWGGVFDRHKVYRGRADRANPRDLHILVF